MLKLHTRQTDTIGTTTMKRARKKMKSGTTRRRQNRSAALGRPAMGSLAGGGLQIVCGRPILALSSALVHEVHECFVLQVMPTSHEYLFSCLFYRQCMRI